MAEASSPKGREEGDLTAKEEEAPVAREEGAPAANPKEEGKPAAAAKEGNPTVMSVPDLVSGVPDLASGPPNPANRGGGVAEGRATTSRGARQHTTATEEEAGGALGACQPTATVKGDASSAGGRLVAVGAMDLATLTPDLVIAEEGTPDPAMDAPNTATAVA
ncbi:hypothetical protein GUJ93_ZPchr0009g2425 [Zizania palustris]|uniref:Uncharacterized protein n=1 Tax=Zizania palustris TaxID=103762 RepID=A0A8J5RLX9_ZIZPA|nr:hypothetical protein GUJ93_ZPchr0009g2425 [Zizania palustris]